MEKLEDKFVDELGCIFNEKQLFTILIGYYVYIVDYLDLDCSSGYDVDKIINCIKNSKNITYNLRRLQNATKITYILDDKKCGNYCINGGYYKLEFIYQLDYQREYKICDVKSALIDTLCNYNLFKIESLKKEIIKREHNMILLNMLSIKTRY